MKKSVLLIGFFFFCVSPFLTWAAISQSPGRLDESVLIGFAISELDARDADNRPVKAEAKIFDPGRTLKVLRLILGSELLLFRVQVSKEALYFSPNSILPPLARVAFNIPEKAKPIRDIFPILPGDGKNRFILNSSVNLVNSVIISSTEKIPTWYLSSSDLPQKFEVLRL